MNDRKFVAWVWSQDSGYEFAAWAQRRGIVFTKEIERHDYLYDVLLFDDEMDARRHIAENPNYYHRRACGVSSVATARRELELSAKLKK